MFNREIPQASRESAKPFLDGEIGSNATAYSKLDQGSQVPANPAEESPEPEPVNRPVGHAQHVRRKRGNCDDRLKGHGDGRGKDSEALPYGGGTSHRRNPFCEVEGDNAEPHDKVKSRRSENHA